MPSAAETGVKALREHLAEALNETAIRGQITYITSRGRRIAAIVPVPIAEAAEHATA